MSEETKLSNEHCNVEFSDVNGNKKIRGLDKTDHYNEPSCYTQNVRGIEKAWEEINNTFNDDTLMRDIFDILDDFKLKPHQYCRID